MGVSSGAANDLIAAAEFADSTLPSYRRLLYSSFPSLSSIYFTLIPNPSPKPNPNPTHLSPLILAPGPIFGRGISALRLR